VGWRQFDVKLGFPTFNQGTKGNRKWKNGKVNAGEKGGPGGVRGTGTETVRKEKWAGRSREKKNDSFKWELRVQRKENVRSLAKLGICGWEGQKRTCSVKSVARSCVAYAELR